MVDKKDFKMTGISQIKIKKKAIWWTVFVLVLFCAIAGIMLWISSTSRPPTVNTGGYTNGNDW
ncbi:MAG: hypothetical protein JKY92_03645 [Magnetovibrio sp.]|nr:hypothetical protein [Magnetovibrio sp.]